MERAICTPDDSRFTELTVDGGAALNNDELGLVRRPAIMTSMSIDIPTLPEC
ncbi:hypothetical protein ACIA8O_14715 [Kitasatospora sp. NPDC051853]|uniref:hypothetical protein n=1 Tax=Kitasatospora sp. NPDC051853 TaxID=3364058 RepID=UPI0037A880D3